MTAIGVVETVSIPLGVLAGDQMVKTAQVELVTAQTVCAGKYIVVVSGEVAAVRSAVAAGGENAARAPVGRLFIAHPGGRGGGGIGGGGVPPAGGGGGGGGRGFSPPAAWGAGGVPPSASVPRSSRRSSPPPNSTRISSREKSPWAGGTPPESRSSYRLQPGLLSRLWQNVWGMNGRFSE